jgi:hypothetical protein
MKYKLFLDDERFPSGDPKDWIIVRSYDEFVDIISVLGCPNFMTLDHDLNSDKTGKDCVNWLIEKDLDNPGFIPKNFRFTVHSMNPVGARNIKELLDGYLAAR